MRDIKERENGGKYLHMNGVCKQDAKEIVAFVRIGD
jgi:hypothetical protein